MSQENRIYLDFDGVFNALNPYKDQTRKDNA